MAKQLNVELNVMANTQKARADLQTLQKSLQEVATSVTKINSAEMGAKSLKEASAAAQELQRHLSNAVNADTGVLNLNKFNASLKQSNTDLTALSSKLLSAGTSGQQAFVKLAQSIANADRPVVSLGSHLSGLLTTLKNTARWQISSSILHGFMGAVQSAYGYAQDLNESLNNIRIVTGADADAMADFAKQANSAAQALSTSTLSYTDAALIYYQQGIRDENEIAERTEATVKLANVSRQSAEEVSDQMTAIWNNFADGSKSLEYYADVITALGASTASSSAEIAGGLEKFAAVADTVGLSYEYAASALATIVATTRQSEDTVGTGLRTLFSRLQSLSLGETLEDGVNLTKYTEALQTVGVTALDASGELREMDDILDDLGERWKTLSDAQQVALAQTVGGVRQYTNLIALMNNWDFMKENVATAVGSEGTLQEQADIFAEGWEAASNRVKASLQAIYNDLLDDKFFISMTDGFNNLLKSVHNFIDGVGGIKTLLIGVGGFFLSSIANQIQPALQNLKISLTTMFQSPEQQAKEYAETLKNTLSAAQEKLGINFDNSDQSTKTALENTRILADAKNRLMIVNEKLSPSERALAEAEMQLIQAQEEEVQMLADKVTAEQAAIDILGDTMTTEAAENEVIKSRKEELSGLIYILQEAQDAYELLLINEEATNDEIEEARIKYENAGNELEEFQSNTQSLVATEGELVQALRTAYEEFLKTGGQLKENESIIVDLGSKIKDTAKEFQDLSSKNSIKELHADIQKFGEQVSQLGLDQIPEVGVALKEAFSASRSGDINRMQKSCLILGNLLSNLKIKIDNNADSAKEFKKLLIYMGDGTNVEKLEQEYGKLNNTINQLKNAQQQLNNALNNFNPEHVMSGIESFSRLAASGMQAAMAINSVKSMINAITSEDMSPLEQLTTILMSFGMLVPSAINSFKGFAEVIGQTTLAEQLNLQMTGALAAARRNELTDLQAVTILKSQVATEEQKEIAQKTLLNNVFKEEELELHALSVQQLEKIVTDQEMSASAKASALAEQLKDTWIKTETGDLRKLTPEEQKKILVEYADKAATDALNVSTKALMGVFGLLLIAITAVVTAIQKHKQVQEEAAQQAIETAKASQEKVDAYKAEQEELSKLINTYNEALKIYQQTGANKAALVTAAEEVATALGLENTALLIAQGRYEELNARIRETLYLQAKAESAELNTNLANAQTAFDSNVKTKMIRREYETTEDVRSNPFLSEAIDSTAGIVRKSELQMDDFGTGETYTITFTAATDRESFEAAQKAIETAEELASEAGESEALVQDRSYIALKAWVDEYEDLYNNLVIAEQAVQDNQANIALFEEMPDGTITSYEEYTAAMSQANNILSQLTDKSGNKVFTDEDDINAAAQAWLGLTNNIQEYLALDSLFAGVQEDTGLTLQEIQDIYNKLDDSLKTVFFNIDFKTLDFSGKSCTPEEVITNAAEDLQGIADQNVITLEVQTYTKAASSLKEGMSAEDYEKFRTDSGINWGGETYSSFRNDNGELEYRKQQILKWEEFLSLSVKQQQAYLTSLSQSAEKALSINLQENISALYEELEDLNKRKESQEAELTALGEKRQELTYLRGGSARRGDTEAVERYDAEIAAIDEEINEWNGLDAAIETTTQQIAADTAALAQNNYALTQSITSLSELKELTDSGLDLGYDVISDTLIRLAENYENCTDELNAYNQALARGSEEQITTTQLELEAAIAAGEAAEAYGIEADYLEILTDSFGDYNDELSKGEGMLQSDAEAAKDAAVRYARLNEAIEDLYDNYDKYEEVLKDLKKAESDQDKAFVAASKSGAALKKSLAGLLDTSEDLLDANFLDAIDPKDLEKAAMGDEKAIKRIRDAFIDVQAAAAGLADDPALDDFKNKLDSLADGAIIDINEDPFLQSLIQAQLAAGATAEDIENLLSGFSIDADVTPLTQAMYEAELAAAEAANSTAQSGDAIVGNLSFNAEANQQTFQGTDLQQDTAFVENGAVTYMTGAALVPEGNGSQPISYVARMPIFRKTVTPIPTTTENVKEQTVTGVKISNAHKSAGGNVSGSNKTTTSPKSSSGGGGGGGSSRKAAEPIQQDERYHVITKQIDSLVNVYDRLAKAKDRAYGANRLKLMEQETKNIQDQIDKQEELISQVEAYIKIDRGNLQHGSGTIKGLDYYGLTAEYDIDGNIINWDQMQAAALAKVNEAIGQYNSGLIDDDAKEAAEKQYEGFLELVEQYEETNEKFQEEMDKRQDLLNQMQDLNYEKLSYELEIKLKLNEASLKKIEYQIKKLGDSFFTSAEALSNLFSLEGNSQATLTVDRLGLYQEQVNKLNEAYEKGEISQADFIEGLEDAKSGLYDALEAILDLNDEIKEWYSDTLSKASEELEKFTDQIEHNISVVEHLQDILSLMGKETDYTAIGYLLSSQYEQTQSAYEASKAYAETMKNQRDAAQAAYDAAVAEGNTAALETLKANLDAAIVAANDAEEQALSDLQRALETGNLLIENELQKAKQNIDNLSTGGKGWDYLNQIIDLAERAADRYLTKTNQIYETNKLLRDIQQDINKTTNNAAKQKLANFSKEIDALQKTTKMSKNELEIAKAQYEVLKAQIALEDARDAKSTVRLQRDSEGNYGYVYTADQEAVNDAAATLEQRQNDLYNLVREQEQQAATELLQLAEERSQAIYDLEYEYYVKRSISEEEFLARRVEIEKYYNQISESLTKDHITNSLLLGQTSVTGTNDTWTNGWADIVGNNYSVISAAEGYATTLAAITGNSIESIEKQVADFNEQAQANADEIVSYLVDADNAIIPIYKRQTETWNESTAGMGNYKQTTDDATNSTISLLNELTGEDGLIQKIDEEATKVRESTEEWSNYYSELIEEVIPGVETLIDRIDGVIERASKQIDVNVVTHYSVDGIGAGSYVAGSSSGGSSSSGSSGSSSGSNGINNSAGAKGSSPTGSTTISGGCFVSGTKIIMQDYSFKNIEDIKVNDYVFAYNEDKKIFEPKRVTKAYIHHKTPRIINIYLSNGINFGITPGHPIMTTQGWKSRDIENSWYEHGVVTSWLNIGDTVIGFGMNAMVIAIKEQNIGNNFDSYNIEVEELHTFIADGIVVHNIKRNYAVIEKFSSGGYTGSWPGADENGKLAFLHEKELVLNAADTENMLAAVKLIRQISNNIDLRAASQASTSGIISPSYLGADQVLEQEVTIHAEFPNVTDHNEIEEAFNNLVNRASQYAGRQSSIKE